jgi:hypothetical protein
MNVFPKPAEPHKNTFLPSFIHFFRRFISLSWSDILSSFFCGFIITKESMSGEDDDLTTQALDMFLENDTLQKRVIDPLKRKILPYIMCIGFFNLILFIMVAYLANRLSLIL